jgi:hypothetical protein
MAHEKFRAIAARYVDSDGDLTKKANQLAVLGG